MLSFLGGFSVWSETHFFTGEHRFYIFMWNDLCLQTAKTSASGEEKKVFLG